MIAASGLLTLDPLIKRIARSSRYQVPGMEPADRIQEARVAAWVALQKFIPASGAVTNYVARCVKNHLINVVRKAYSPSASGASLARSLDELLYPEDEGGETLADRLADPVDCEELAVDGAHYRKIINRALQLCSETERHILLGYRDGKTDVEMGRELDITKQSVQERRTRLFAKLRKHLEKEGFTP